MASRDREEEMKGQLEVILALGEQLAAEARRLPREALRFVLLPERHWLLQLMREVARDEGA